MTGYGRPDNELFSIPRKDDQYYLYAPLRRRLAVVNAATVSAVASWEANGTTSLGPKEKEIIETLEETGLIGLEPSPRPSFPRDIEFRPHEVTLFPTSRCNLRCRYCYADAGRKSTDMRWEIARAAIELVATNAGILGSQKFAVGFHGGGEPTMAWDLIVRCVDYAKQKAEETGLDAELFIATNGILTPRKREFLANHFTSVNVSLDGPASIQDVNRPTSTGNGSYLEVRDTLKYFDHIGFEYGIRSTITNAAVGRMVEIVESLTTEFNLSYLHLEPVWFCGRCLTSGESPPAHGDFSENFLLAEERGMELGIRVIYSGSRLDVLTSKFCAAPGDGFSVLPEGIATSCYEITEPDDPRAKIFHYGKYNPESGIFEFDPGRVAALQKLSVENLPFCRDCFCKWHCAGDCLAKAFEKSGSDTHEGSPRCELNRCLTLSHLEDLVESSEHERSELKVSKGTSDDGTPRRSSNAETL